MPPIDAPGLCTLQPGASLTRTFDARNRSAGNHARLASARVRHLDAELGGEALALVGVGGRLRHVVSTALGQERSDQLAELFSTFGLADLAALLHVLLVAPLKKHVLAPPLGAADDLAHALVDALGETAFSLAQNDVVEQGVEGLWLGGVPGRGRRQEDGPRSVAQGKPRLLLAPVLEGVYPAAQAERVEQADEGIRVPGSVSCILALSWAACHPLKSEPIGTDRPRGKTAQSLDEPAAWRFRRRTARYVS